MTKSIKVSILTPCYNSEDFLERYLLNILEQSYSNIEQIIVNDGSQDRTEEIKLGNIATIVTAIMKFNIVTVDKTSRQINQVTPPTIIAAQKYPHSLRKYSLTDFPVINL